jgi:hypothetical protein
MLLTGVLCLTALPRTALACKWLDRSLQAGGILAADRDHALPPIPRNAAFFSHSLRGEEPETFVIAVDTGDQTLITGRAVRRIQRGPEGVTSFVVKTDALLAPHRMLANPDRTRTYITADYVDNQPPTAPTVTGGALVWRAAFATCPATVSLEFTIAEPATDDYAPAETLAYAVYLATSAEAAATASTPYVLLAGPSALPFIMGSWSEDDSAYITVSAMDFAGNESPRSAPVLVHQGTNTTACACAIPMHRGNGTTAAAGLALLAMLATVRRRARRG